MPNNIFKFTMKSASFSLRCLLSKWSIYAIYLALFCVLTAFTARKAEEKLHLLQTVLTIIKTEYINEVTTEDMMKYAVQGILSSLDPHSEYLDAKAYSNIKNISSGQFEGLGIELTTEQGFPRVIAPYTDTPAHKAGIKAGDYITAVDGVLLKGFKLSEAAEKLRGKAGTSVHLQIYREHAGVLDFNIKRDVVHTHSVHSKVLSDGEIGYIRISMFSEQTAQNARDHWKLILQQNPNIIGLVLDLRNNPGGLLEQGSAVADLFLTTGDIVKIQAKDPQHAKIVRATPDDISEDRAIAVLIDEGTASAAEIVAGAIQDNKRGIIVGIKSFGKGSIQKVIPLSDGSAVKLTSSLYYTPSGTSIQAHGIIPDIIVPEALVQPKDKRISALSEASLRGHLVNKNKPTSTELSELHEPQELTKFDENSDFQLMRAIDIVKTIALLKTKLH